MCTAAVLNEHDLRLDERVRALNEAADRISALPCGNVHEMDVLMGLARDMIAKMVRDMASSAAAAPPVS
ncbi:hypothetical protein [Georgenia sp. SYP-B2076]|uniref:hypothetical protein n=1 Tax=Georgenia sp. SYP-B2076 TaxID=2495881 RepID=UPI000F8D09D0|nr:hypothetical protein [Georgenia sp. SYP-B2076]